MNSSDYEFKYTNINITSGNKESEGYKLSDTVGQTAAGEFASNGYIIKAGFQYLRGRQPFRFTVSDTFIDLGILTANVHSSKPTTLTVVYGSVGKYQVTAAENGPMTTLDKLNTIPDTSCDGGNQSCNENEANVWTLKTAYGFGYNIKGQDIVPDFKNTDYYRPFADMAAGEPYMVIMKNSRKIGTERKSVVTFKANISNLQPAGTYQTVISFVATPSY